MIPNKRKLPQDHNEAWLMSYADMITLLLCFFVIFVSVSEPKKEKIKQITEGMSGKFGALHYETPFSQSLRALQTVVEEGELYRDIAVGATPHSLSIELATGRFFNASGAEINEEMRPVLAKIAATLASQTLAGYQISIESHTDDTPPQSGLYANNWELSSVRAARIARYLSEEGLDAARLKATGYGDSRPEVPNVDAKGKPIAANRARNQRILIRLEE